MINRDQRRRPVRDDHHDAAARPHVLDGRGQCAFTFCIEIRVWLVKHHKKWITIERARQRDSLALAGRERCAILADVRSPFPRPRDLVIGETKEFNEICTFLREKIEEGYGRARRVSRARSSAPA